MPPTHHPDEAMLLAYAAGSGESAPDLVVATHLALCPRCRREVRRLEAIGGSLLEEMPASPVPGGFAAVLETARRPAPAVAAPSGENQRLPQPLRSLVGPWDAVGWSHLPFGARSVELPSGGRLVCLPEGVEAPHHTHSSSEIFMVLTGAFEDGLATYARGDVSLADESVAHAMRILPGEECIAIVVRDGPILAVESDGSAGPPIEGY